MTLKEIGWVLGLGIFGTGMAAASQCETQEYIVGMESSRPDNANGWAIWLSQKPYFDSTATKYPTDLGGRLDLNKDRGRFLFSMAMNAMNMGYPVTISDVYGAQFCDDFQDLEVSGVP